LWWAFVIAVFSWSAYSIIKAKPRSAYVLPIIFISLIVFITIPKPHKAMLNWQAYSKHSFQQPKTKHQVILLAFTANWCITCKLLEATVYQQNKVIKAATAIDLQSFKIDMTHSNAKLTELLREYQGSALPYLVILNQQRKVVLRQQGMFTAKYLSDMLHRLADAQK